MADKHAKDTTPAGRSFRVNEHSAAPVERVWEVLVDHARYREWTPVLRSTLEANGHPDVNGVGAVRALGTPFYAARERVTVFEPPHRLCYELVSGLPVTGYAAEVVLSPSANGGTHITWTGRFDAAAPGLSGVMLALLHRTIVQTARGLARHAAATASPRSAA